MAARQKLKSPAETNGWDVLIRFLDLINDLFKTGNIFGVVLILVFAFTIFLTHKLPSENLNALILMLLKFLRAEKYYIFPGGFMLVVSLAANYYQHRIYTREINRLAEVRSNLVHGRTIGETNLLTEHSSSEFDIEATD